MPSQDRRVRMSDDQDFGMNNKCGTQYLYPITPFVTSLTWSLTQKFLLDQSHFEFSSIQFRCKKNPRCQLFLNINFTIHKLKKTFLTRLNAFRFMILWCTDSPRRGPSPRALCPTLDVRVRACTARVITYP